MTMAITATAESGEAGLIRGYASLFGVTDMAGDRVEPGAFRASIAKRGAAGIRMLWQHEPGRPIGVWTAVREDRTGLLVEGRLALSTRSGREAFALIRSGAVDGLSIGFRTKRARRDAAGAKRRLVEIDLWEVSVVTFPMQERARVLETRCIAGATPPPELAARLLAEAERLFSPRQDRR